MSKRFTDTEKWKDDWFLSLSNDEKVAWFWLLDNCNHAGICKPSIGLLNFMCRTNYTEDQLIQIMEGRILKFETMWFIPKFLKFQYGTLVSKMPAVKSVVKELKSKKLLEFSKDFIEIQDSENLQQLDNSSITVVEQLDNSLITVKDKDKDKDKDKVSIDFKGFSYEFVKKWSEWKNYKKTQYKFTFKLKSSEQISFNNLYKLSNQIEDNAISIIDQSIANGWKGFFELKNKQHETANRDQARVDYWNHMVDTFGTDEEKATRKIV